LVRGYIPAKSVLTALATLAELFVLMEDMSRDLGVERPTETGKKVLGDKWFAGKASKPILAGQLRTGE
jgi:hypothetical protein